MEEGFHGFQGNGGGVSEGRGYRSSLAEYKGGEVWKINCQSAAKEGKGDPEYITEPYGWDQVYFIVTQPNPLTLLHPSRVPCFITLLTKVVFLPVFCPASYILTELIPW